MDIGENIYNITAPGTFGVTVKPAVQATVTGVAQIGTAAFITCVTADRAWACPAKGAIPAIIAQVAAAVIADSAGVTAPLTIGA